MRKLLNQPMSLFVAVALTTAALACAAAEIAAARGDPAARIAVAPRLPPVLGSDLAIPGLR